MIVSIAQPAYLPWLGYLDRIRRSDLHVVLDTVPMDHASRTKFANRNRVRTADGWCWLTVPVLTKGEARHTPLRELEIVDDAPWAAKHLRTLEACYARAPFFATHEPFLRETYAAHWRRLEPLCRHLTDWLLAAFAVRTPLVAASTLGVGASKDELILGICREVGATTYVSGPFGRDYLREELFEQAGIEVVYDAFVHPVYQQVFPGFEPAMSAIDMLFNLGEACAPALAGEALAA